MFFYKILKTNLVLKTYSVHVLNLWMQDGLRLTDDRIWDVVKYVAALEVCKNKFVKIYTQLH